VLADLRIKLVANVFQQLAIGQWNHGTQMYLTTVKSQQWESLANYKFLIGNNKAEIIEI